MRWHTIFAYTTSANAISAMLRTGTVCACLYKAFFVAVSINNGRPGRYRIAVRRSSLYVVIGKYMAVSSTFARYFSWTSHLTRRAIYEPRIHRRSRRTESRRRIDEARAPIPSVPAAWRPAPAAPADKYPTAIAEWHPAPRIGGNPRRPETSIGIVAVAVWVPILANAVRLPDVSIFRVVSILSVRIQVAGAVLVG